MLEGQTREVNPGVLAPVLVEFFIASRYSGYSRNMRLTQNARTLPLRSSDAGTMYPLMIKKTKTP